MKAAKDKKDPVLKEQDIVRWFMQAAVEKGPNECKKVKMTLPKQKGQSRFRDLRQITGFYSESRIVHQVLVRSLLILHKLPVQITQTDDRPEYQYISGVRKKEDPIWAGPLQ